MSEARKARTLAAWACMAFGLAGCAGQGFMPMQSATPAVAPLPSAPQPSSPPANTRTETRTVQARSAVPEAPVSSRRTASAEKAAPMCVAPNVLATSLALLPADQAAELQKTLTDGAALNGQRVRWRADVGKANTETTRLYMPPPGFGCNNPGLGDALKSPGRSDPKSMWANPDCVGEVDASVARGLPAMTTANQQARNVVTEQIKRLKAEDAELADREQALALALSQQLQRSVQQWARTPADSFKLEDLVAMESLRNQVVMQCTTQQARSTPASEAQVQQATAALTPVLDAVLALRANNAANEMRQAGSKGALMNTTKRLFPTPLLEQRAKAQPAIAAALAGETTRVAALDEQAERDKKVRMAELNQKALEVSPEYIARKRYQQNAASNAAPTSEDMLELIFNSLIAERDDKVSSYKRVNGNQLRQTRTLPVLGTFQVYLADIQLKSMRCTPSKGQQTCELEYSEVTLAGEDTIHAPWANTNRKHRVDVNWTDDGLQSAQLLAGMKTAYKPWHDAVNAQLAKQNEAHSRWYECKQRLGYNASRSTVSRVCGFEP